MTATASNVGFGIGIGALVIFWFVVVIGSLVMMVVALVDIVKRPDWQWKLAGQEKILWLLLVILVNVLAIPSLIYWFSIRPKLLVVQQAAANGDYGPGQMTYAGWEPTPHQPVQPGWAPAGWYQDPNRPGQFRWWDGAQWTEHVSGGGVPTPEA